MRELLATVEPSLWTEISAAVFAAWFVWLVFWVYSPTRKQTYQYGSALPLEND